MSGPANPNPRQTAMGGFQELQAQFGSGDWRELEEMFKPALVTRDFEPDEKLKRFAAACWSSGEGRAFIDWLFDLTCRAPYPVTSQDMNDLAFAAAKHQARAAVGETLAACICDGLKILNR